MQEDIKMNSSKKDAIRKDYLAILVIFLVVFLFNENQPQEGLPDGIIPTSVMKSIIWDYTNAEVYQQMKSSSGNLDTSTIGFANIQQAILKHYKVDKSVYDKSYDYYQNHPALLGRTIEEILNDKQWVVFGDTVKALD